MTLKDENRYYPAFCRKSLLIAVLKHLAKLLITNSVFPIALKIWFLKDSSPLNSLIASGCATAASCYAAGANITKPLGTLPLGWSGTTLPLHPLVQRRMT